MSTIESVCKKIESLIEDGKGVDLVTIDMLGKSTIADYMLVVSGNSSRHVSSLSQNIMEGMAKVGNRAHAIEGLTLGDWVLIDFGDVIVHVFRPEIREHYALEKMWGDLLSKAPTV